MARCATQKGMKKFGVPTLVGLFNPPDPPAGRRASDPRRYGVTLVKVPVAAQMDVGTEAIFIGEEENRLDREPTTGEAAESESGLSRSLSTWR